ncbi:hypothetical protein, partial [Dactylosporangium fulvum]
MTSQDEAPLREQAKDWARTTVDGWKQQANDAAKAHAAASRAWLVRRLRHWSAETRKHRPSVFAALALIVAGLPFAAEHRLAAAAAGWLTIVAGAPAAYLV